MEIEVPVLIGIGLAVMFFGYFFGLFEGRGQGYKKRKKEETQDQVPASVPPQRSPAAVTAAPPGQNLLELARDDAGRPYLRLDGEQVDASNVASGQRRRLIELMIMLRPWVEPTVASDGASASAPGVEVPRPSMPKSSGAAPAAPAIGPAVTPPVPASTPPTAAPLPGSMSLVQQIDAVLQARLVGTPLAGRGIRLAEALHGGAIVFIGSTQYDGVDSIPDPEIQAAIRSAIGEWEKRYTPG